MSYHTPGIISDGGSKTTIFAVRTTIGQEKSVLQNIFNRLRVLNPFPDLKCMMIAEELRGYVFIEAVHQRDVMIAISGLRHVKGKIVGSISLESIAHVISPRKVTEILEEGDTVEIISGIFTGQKAEVVRMPKEGAKEEVTLRLLDSDSAISIKIHGDFLKLVEKGARHQEVYDIKEMEELNNTTIPSSSFSKDDTKVRIADSDTSISSHPEEIFSFDSGEEELEENDKEGEEEEFTSKEMFEKSKEEEEEEEEDEWAKFGF
ncbi:MAG: transcription elongation factor Spt5 [Candidatus Lokiarchaeota archaeon]|nr:transcription elongation factor Spt5 [Candidatus Harpocratesius repetitus]